MMKCLTLYSQNKEEDVVKMEKRTILAELIRAYTFDMIDIDNRYFQDDKYEDEVRYVLEQFIIDNYEKEALSKDEKDNLLTLIGYFRFDKKYKTEQKRGKVWDWCNKMIENINRSTSDYYFEERIQLLVEHGYQFEHDITYEEFESLNKIVKDYSKIEFQLLDSLFSNTMYDINDLEKYMSYPHLELCLFYLLNKYKLKFSKQDLDYLILLIATRSYIYNLPLSTEKEFYKIKIEEPIDKSIYIAMDQLELFHELVEPSLFNTIHEQIYNINKSSEHIKVKR